MYCICIKSLMIIYSGSEVTQSCPTLSDPVDCSLPGSSVHGIFQAVVLEWGAVAFSMCPVNSSPFLCPSAPDNHPSTFYLCEFNCVGYLT